ncbi:hypothetical protein FOZ62_017651 [Perkinsus olseni]|uniref:Uncharacterized protein n=1 Tax=Perkinsus olseni TaxID=32597 RepID=A0A7J6QFY7_PEROL|nr:hypothetical protein FOZ62_017651 [Perkinsus olseni]
MRKILPFALVNLRYAYSGSLKAQFTVEGGGQAFFVDADDSADGSRLSSNRVILFYVTLVLGLSRDCSGLLTGESYSWFSAAVDGGHLAHCQLVRIDLEVLCLMGPGSIPAPSFSPVPDGTSHEEGSVGIVVADGVVTALAFNAAPGTRDYCAVGTMTAEDLTVLRDVATQVDRAERDSMLREGRRYVRSRTAEVRDVVAIASDGPAAHSRKLRSSMGFSNVVPLPAPPSSLTQPHILIGGRTTMIPKTMDRGEFTLPPPSAIRFGPLPAWPTRPVYEDIEADGPAPWGYVGVLLMLLTVLLGVVYRKEVEQVVEEASQVDHYD